MKYLKTLLYVVLTVILFSTSHASSVLSTSDITSEVYRSVPKTKVKKEKIEKKNKLFKLKKVLSPPGDGSGFNITSFVTGLLALFLVWLPYLGLVLSILAIVFGAIGFKKKLRGLGITGFVLGILLIVPAIILTLLFG